MKTTTIIAVLAAFVPLSAIHAQKPPAKHGELERCVTFNRETTKEIRAQFATAMQQGMISGSELQSFNASIKRLEAHEQLYRKEGLTLDECRKLKAEVTSVKADVEKYARTGAVTATVSPAHLTVKAGGSANFTINCSSGDPTVGFTPPAGGIGASGGGVFTLKADATKPPGEHVGTIKCGMTTVATKLGLTVTK